MELDRRENPYGRREDDGLRAVFAVSHHLISGKVANNGQRLLDVLNDKLSDFVTLDEAEVFAATGESIAQLPNAIIPKSELLMAVVPGERHEAPEKRTTRFRSKKQYSAFVIADRFAINGRLHLEGSGHASVTYQKELGEYAAIDEATVTNLYGDGMPVDVQVAIVSKSAVVLLRVGDRATRELDYEFETF